MQNAFLISTAAIDCFNALFYSDYKPLCLQALLKPLTEMYKPGAHKRQITDYAKVLSFYLKGHT